MESLDPGEAILDDVFVLWRAFEATLDTARAFDQRDLCRRAVVDVISYLGIGALPKTARFITTLSCFEVLPPRQFAEWFDGGSSGSADAREQLINEMARLRQAVKPPVRWSKRESTSLGDILYRIRCAVIHSRLDTHNSAVTLVLPAIRLAMIELLIARAAEMASVPLDRARAEFDSAE